MISTDAIQDLIKNLNEFSKAVKEAREEYSEEELLENLRIVRDETIKDLSRVIKTTTEIYNGTSSENLVYQESIKMKIEEHLNKTSPEEQLEVIKKALIFARASDTDNNIEFVYPLLCEIIMMLKNLMIVINPENKNKYYLFDELIK